MDFVRNGLGYKQMSDFEYSMTHLKDADLIVEKATVTNFIKQHTRLRQAWSAVKKVSADQENIRKRGLDEADLDGLLSQPDLLALRGKFWLRYRFTWLPESWRISGHQESSSCSN